MTQVVGRGPRDDREIFSPPRRLTKTRIFRTGRVTKMNEMPSVNFFCQKSIIYFLWRALLESDINVQNSDSCATEIFRNKLFQQIYSLENDLATIFRSLVCHHR